MKFLLYGLQLVAHCQWLPGSSQLKVTRSGWPVYSLSQSESKSIVKGLKLFEFKANLVSWVDSGQGHTERPYLKTGGRGKLAFTLLCDGGQARV